MPLRPCIKSANTHKRLTGTGVIVKDCHTRVLGGETKTIAHGYRSAEVGGRMK